MSKNIDTLESYLWRFWDVDDLLEPGYTECYVFGRHTGEMESVECHLSGGLTNRLGGDGTHHLTGNGVGQVKSGLNLTHQPLEGLQETKLLSLVRMS